MSIHEAQLLTILLSPGRRSRYDLFRLCIDLAQPHLDILASRDDLVFRRPARVGGDKRDFMVAPEEEGDGVAGDGRWEDAVGGRDEDIVWHVIVSSKNVLKVEQWWDRKRVTVRVGIGDVLVQRANWSPILMTNVSGIQGALIPTHNQRQSGRKYTAEGGHTFAFTVLNF